MADLLVRIKHWTGWLSLLFIVFFAVTGFAMAGMWSMDKVIRPLTATRLHTSPYAVYPMILVVAIHSILRLQRACGKWLARK